MPLLLCALLAVTLDVLPDSTNQRPRYTIDATLADDGSVAVTATLELPRAAWRRGNVLHLALPSSGSSTRAPRLRVTAIRDETGKPLSFELRGGGTEVVVHRAPASGKRPTLISLVYHAAADSAQRRSFGYDLFAATEAADSWYPVAADLPESLSRFRDFDVRLTIPAGIAVMTSAGARASADTAHVESFAVKHIEGFTLAFGQHLVTRAVTRGSLTVTALVPPELAVTYDSIATRTAAAAEWYRERLGFFPLTHVGILPGYRNARGGWPMSNVFMIHRGDLSTLFTQWITAHELGHYYWGLYVLGAEERLSWVMLANGIWADQLYLSELRHVPLEEVWRDLPVGTAFFDFARAQLAGNDQRLGLKGAAEDSLDFDYNSWIRHSKAAIGVYLLARRVGTARYLQLQRKLLEQFRYLPMSAADFSHELEANGVPGAAEFISRWSRGDARIGYTVSQAVPDSSNGRRYQITIARTGTVWAPLTVEIVDSVGRTQRHDLTGAASLDTVVATLDAPLKEIRLDPDGVLPMWSGGNAAIRALWLRAGLELGFGTWSVGEATELLARRPDDELRAAVGLFLADQARWTDLSRFADGAPSPTCVTRNACRYAIAVARSALRAGSAARARELLDRIRVQVDQYGLLPRWQAASNEVTEGARSGG